MGTDHPSEARHSGEGASLAPTEHLKQLLRERRLVLVRPPGAVNEELLRWRQQHYRALTAERVLRRKQWTPEEVIEDRVRRSKTLAPLFEAYPYLKNHPEVWAGMKTKIWYFNKKHGGYYFARPIQIQPVSRKAKYHRMNFGDEEIRFDGSVDSTFKLYDVWFLMSGKEMGRYLVAVVRDLFRRELMGALPKMDREMLQGTEVTGAALLEHLVQFRHLVYGTPLETLGGSKLQITCRPTGAVIASWTWGKRNSKF